MGISDILWPFNKKFSEIPGAREAALASLGGGPVLGAITIILSRNPRIAFKVTTYSGLALFWVTFLGYRLDMITKKQLSREFQKAVEDGKID